MNDRVREYIDGLFAGKQMNEQARELYDELLDNCAQRFEDDLADGLTEDQAIQRIADSMGDIDELLKDSNVLKNHTRTVDPAHEPSGIEARFDVGGIKTVKISLSALSIALEPIEGNMLMIAFEGPDEDFKDVVYQLNEGVLEIKQKTRIFFGLGLLRWHHPSKVRLGVPESAYLKYKLECISGGIQSRVDMSSAKISTISGKIAIESPSKRGDGQLSISCQSGSVTIHGQFDRSKIDITSGTVKFSGGSQMLNIHSVSGTQEIQGHYGLIDLQVISGKVRMDGTFKKAKLNTTSGPIYITCRRAPESIQAHMISGSLNVELPEDIAGFTAKHSAISGRLHNAFGSTPYGNGELQIAAEAISGPLRITKGPAANAT